MTIKMLPASVEQERAFHAGNKSGMGYIPGDDLERAFLAQFTGRGHAIQLKDMSGRNAEDSWTGEVLVTEDGRTAVADVNGPWAVDIAQAAR